MLGSCKRQVRTNRRRRGDQVWVGGVGVGVGGAAQVVLVSPTHEPITGPSSLVSWAASGKPSVLIGQYGKNAQKNVVACPSELSARWMSTFQEADTDRHACLGVSEARANPA